MGKADRMLWLAVASVAAFALPDRPVLTWFLALVLAVLLATLGARLRGAWLDLEDRGSAATSRSAPAR